MKYDELLLKNENIRFVTRFMVPETGLVVSTMQNSAWEITDFSL
jgi:hypothetical protein